MLVLLDTVTRVTAEDASCFAAARGFVWLFIEFRLPCFENSRHSFPGASQGIVYERHPYPMAHQRCITVSNLHNISG